MTNNYCARELGKLQRRDDGDGWEYEETYPNGWQRHASVSAEGFDQLVALARIHEVHADGLLAWLDVYGLTVCEHGRPLNDLAWSINDYAFDWRDGAHEAVFMLDGWHERDDDPLGDFCVAMWYRAVGAHAGVFSFEPAVVVA